ncbi:MULTISPECIES: hypothetical protein [Acinetobacter calcoaceticus/baumannii complex]|uniref:Uncharacterized protein n=1 Tax=Acinetobacter lactucae TaxID=1785128 RepID=A0A1V0K7M3_9GAMM|nr:MULTISPECIES: hypothetical protein [Acinetobacter calcoaceticus/baumannii complex]ARD27670.1 hypothetical protein OTEC02_01985 [Acinetobacter lactucae]MBJ8438684.1 hypothetical protein [Acinetobacter lactucae]MCG9491881.1 hypothetical protein [Acinetobacter pittii]QWZ61380.1 hypothetical protein I6L28_05200 [Acinetobacter pittii]QXA07565.1 hypothetical protein I6L27_16995 [Acinetobacter pittii]
MSKIKRKETIMAQLKNLLVQHGLPYLFIALVLCNGVYFAYAFITGSSIEQFQISELTSFSEHTSSNSIN